MKFYKTFYSGTKCKFEGEIYRAEKLEGDKVFIDFSRSSLSRNQSFVYVAQLEQLTEEEIKEFKRRDNLPRGNI